MKTILITDAELKTLLSDAVKQGIETYMPAQAVPKEIGGLELAEEITGLARPTIYMLTSTNAIPHMKVGSKLRFNRTDLMKWIEDKNQQVK